MWSLASLTQCTVCFNWPWPNTPTTQGTSTHLCWSCQLQFEDCCVWWPLLRVTSSCPLPVLPWQGHSSWQSTSSQGSLVAAPGSQHWLQHRLGYCCQGMMSCLVFGSLLWDMQRLSIQCWQQAAIIARFGQNTSASTTNPKFHCVPLVLLGCW